MKKIPVCFEDAMHKVNKSFSPSSSKPKLVVEDWKTHFPSYVEIENFTPIKKEDFYLVHDKHHVDGIFNGTEENGFEIKDAEFASTFRYTSGSIYAACLFALKEGIAVSPTSGFHHAEYDRSMGFCTFNGLALAAKMLHEKHSLGRIGILDFDMHYGNGTDNLIAKHHMDYVEHYTAGGDYDIYIPHPIPLKNHVKMVYDKIVEKAIRSDLPHGHQLRQELLKKLGEVFMEQIPTILESFKNCNLIIYQAGADQHINDPYGGLIDYVQMKLRDQLVFEFAKKHKIPLAWNLAGGYQRDAEGGIEPVLLCHRNTMQACVDVYCK